MASQGNKRVKEKAKLLTASVRQCIAIKTVKKKPKKKPKILLCNINKQLTS